MTQDSKYGCVVHGLAHPCEDCAEELTSEARDAARWRWLLAQHDPVDLPIAQVVWKRGNDARGEWVNMVNGADLTLHIDAAIAGVRPLEAPSLSLWKLCDLLVACEVVYYEAVADSEGYDGGVTLGRIERLHKALAAGEQKDGGTSK